MIPDGWEIRRTIGGSIEVIAPDGRGCSSGQLDFNLTGELLYALGDALLRSEQERSEEAGDAAKCDAAFDRWYAAQRHQLTNEQVCRLIWTRGWNAAIDAAMAKGDSK